MIKKVTQAGKGDKNRTTNYQAYWDSDYWKNKDKENKHAKRSRANTRRNTK